MDSDFVPAQVLNRPELSMFESQRMQLSASESLLSKNRIPKISGFGQLGYGNPGYNLLLNSFEPFYMVGLRLNWNVWDWKATKNDKLVLNHQAQMLTNQEEAFVKNINIGSQEIYSRIRKMDRVIETDNQIIDLRKQITASSSSQLKNGVITSSDYIDDLKEESIAVLTHQLHLIELSKAKSELANLLGSEIK
jgi:outer membrane protein TolC